MNIAQPRQGSLRFIAGDPLRALACIGILIWHVVVNGAALTPPDGVSAYYQSELGFLGRPIYELSMSVWLFFGLSGYLIAGPFVRAIVTGSDRRPALRPYFRNRVLRIVPAFWFFLTLTLIIVGTEGDSLRHIVAFYGLAHVYAIGPFTERMVQAWTIDVEVVFYIVVPLVFLPLAALLARRWTPAGRAYLIVAGCAIVALASLAMGERFFTSGRCVPGSAWAFTPGIALAALEPVWRPRLAGRDIARKIGWILLAIAAAAYLTASYVLQFNSPIQQNCAAFVVVGCLIAGPLLMQWSDGRATRLFDNVPLHWVGQRAYGIYLAHVLVIHEVRPLTETLPSMRAVLVVTLPLVAVISGVAGALSFRFIERPFLELRAPWRSSEPAPVLAPATTVPTMPPALQQQA